MIIDLDNLFSNRIKDIGTKQRMLKRLNDLLITIGPHLIPNNGGYYMLHFIFFLLMILGFGFSFRFRIFIMINLNHRRKRNTVHKPSGRFFNLKIEREHWDIVRIKSLQINGSQCWICHHEWFCFGCFFIGYVTFRSVGGGCTFLLYIRIGILVYIHISIRRPTFLGTCRTRICVIFISIIIVFYTTFHDFQEIRNIKMFRQFNSSIPRNHPSNFPQGTHHDTLSISFHGIGIHHTAPTPVSTIIIILPLTLGALPLIIYIHINRNSLIRPNRSLNDTPMLRRRQLPPFPQLQISLI